MEEVAIAGTDLKVARIGLGTWAMGGWMWGGSDEQEAIRTIHAGLEQGINLIDAAQVYGFGKSEKTVGRALAEYGRREQMIVTQGKSLWGPSVGRQAPKLAYATQFAAALSRSLKSEVGRAINASTLRKNSTPFAPSFRRLPINRRRMFVTSSIPSIDSGSARSKTKNFRCPRSLGLLR